MKKTLLLSIMIMSLMVIPLSASAFVINDTGDSAYWGGRVVNKTPTYYGDEISGGLNEFSVDSLTAGIITQNEIDYYSFTLKGDYFYNAYYDVGLAQDYPPGDLYLSTSGWRTNGTLAHYADDTFRADEGWNYVLSSDRSNAGLYELDFETITMTSAPSNYIYRADQAWTGGYGDLVSNDVIINFYVDDTNHSDSYLQFLLSADVILLNLDQIGYHWTMACGNDVVEGGGTPVPEPMTMLLLGFGLLGLGLARRKS